MKVIGKMKYNVRNIQLFKNFTYKNSLVVLFTPLKSSLFYNKALLFTSFHLFSTLIFAESNKDSTISTSKHNPNYLTVFRDHLSLTALICTRGTDLRIHNLDNRKQMAIYTPNNVVNYGFGINYRWFAFEGAFRIPFLDRQDTKKGSTKSYYLEARVIRRKFWAQAFLQSNIGYYLSNVKEFDSKWFDQNTNYFLRPDVRTTIAFLSGNYIFNNRKFSYKAVSNMFEWQKKSAGSFMIGGTITNFNCNADTSLLPFNTRDRFSKRSHVNNINVLLSGLNLGYLHTFVIKSKMFIHLGLIQTLGFKNYRYTDAITGTADVHNGFGYILDARFATGYNSDKLYFGASINSLFLNDSSGNQGVMEMNFIYFKLLFGKRFQNLPFVKTKKKETYED